MRFIIKYGRFGSYFYDTLTKQELDLFQVLELLNNYDDMEVKQLEQLEGEPK